MKTFNLFLTIVLVLFTLVAFAQEAFIYVSDAGNFNNPPWQILKYDSEGENPEVFIDQELGWPQDIVFLEDEQTVIISNLNTNRITKYNATTGAYIEDFASVAGGPTRMRIGDDGLLYVLQWNLTENKVLRFQLDGVFVDEFTTVGVPRSIGMDWDSNGNLLVVSYNGRTVRKFDPNGNDLGLIVNTELTGPTDIWVGENDALFVLDWTAGNIEEYDMNGNHTGTFIDNLSQPEGVAFLPDGSILIGNGGTGAVKLFDSEGSFIEDFIPEGSGGLMQPNAVLWRDVTLSIDDFQTNKVIVYPSTGAVFHLNSTVVSQFESVEIYTTSGKKIETLHPFSDTLWEAFHLAEGLYFVVAEGANGRLSQKIIVEK